MNPNFRNFALWVIIILLVVALVMLFQNPGQRVPSQDIAFSQLLNEVDQGHVREVTIAGKDYVRGDRVLCAIASANQDEDAFPNADVMDIARTLAGSPIRRIIEIDVSADETRRLLLWLDAVSQDHVVLGVQPLEL